jgi:muconate cycloisomerase
MRIYPGNHPSTSIATMSVVHLAAAWPGPLLDGAFAVGIENLVADVVQRPVRMQGNGVVVPDEPGLGVALDDDLIREFAAPV